DLVAKRNNVRVSRVADKLRRDVGIDPGRIGKGLNESLTATYRLNSRMQSCDTAIAGISVFKKKSVPDQINAQSSRCQRLRGQQGHPHSLWGIGVEQTKQPTVW